MRRKHEEHITAIEIEGSTTKDAIKLGLQKLGLPKSKVRIKVLSEGKVGLFGMKGSKLAKVRLVVKE